MALFSSYEDRVAKAYEKITDRHHVIHKTYFMNMGYWDDGTETLEEAGQALSQIVADAGKFSPEDRILDVGFGVGEPAMYWMEKIGPREIVGLNITALQVQRARERVEERGLSDRFDLRQGSATELPFEDGSFDKVVALECAFHFRTREDFFHEAFRTLRPGGRIVTADMIAMPGQKKSHRSLLKDNMYEAPEYIAKLEKAGFVGAEVRSIRDGVVDPFMEYLADTMRKGSIWKRIELKLRSLLLTTDFDYVIATADKPE